MANNLTTYIIEMNIRIEVSDEAQINDLIDEAENDFEKYYPTVSGLENFPEKVEIILSRGKAVITKTKKQQ